MESEISPKLEVPTSKPVSLVNPKGSRFRYPVAIRQTFRLKEMVERPG